jgi:predicted TPR repeat methyltransferase
MLQGLQARPDASAELILAADAMVYVAELAPVVTEAARVLAAGGLFAFTTETHSDEGVVIGEGLRYAHAAAYVRAVIESAGLKLALLEDRSARNEDNAPVPGLVAVAAKA